MRRQEAQQFPQRLSHSFDFTLKILSCASQREAPLADSDSGGVDHMLILWALSVEQNGIAKSKRGAICDDLLDILWRCPLSFLVLSVDYH